MSSQRDQVMKGLKHLAGSDEIIGNIVAYCVNSFKADPSARTMEKVKQYVSDTANSVSEHVLTIAHNLNRIIDAEANQIEAMSSQIGYIQHRLKVNQTYMSELYMTKFQTFPRPKPTLHILRQTIPDDQLPKYARPKKPWVRSEFNYAILDQVGNRLKTTGPAKPGSPLKGHKPRDSGLGLGYGGKSLFQQQKEQRTSAMLGNAPMYQASPKAMNAPATMSSMSSQKKQVVAASPLRQPLSPQQQQQHQQQMQFQLSQQQQRQAPPSFNGPPPPAFGGAGGPPAVPNAGGPPKFQSQYQVKKQAKGPPKFTGQPGPPPPSF